jgi:hypothetical protein
MITFELLLIAATVGALPTITKLVRAVIRLVVGLVTTVFMVGLTLLVLVNIATHGKLL